MQGKRRFHRAYQIPATVNDLQRKGRDPVTLFQNLVLGQKITVHRIVQFDSGLIHGLRGDVITQGIQVEVGAQRDLSSPMFPGARGPPTREFIAPGKLGVEGQQGMFPLALRQGTNELLPGFRINAPHSAGRDEPIQIRLARQKGSPQDQSQNPLRKCLSIQQGQRGAPGPPKQRPMVDTQFAA